jgi:hypothetical protein
MSDTIRITRQLVEIYDTRIDEDVFEWSDPIVTAARFGCIGCPAIQRERHAPKSSLKRHGNDSPLNELYDVWFEARQRKNRLYGAKCKKQFGPIKMAVRRRLFDRVMDIQRRAGMVLISPEDEAFIFRCWHDKVYPRGWSEADEATPHPSDTPLFDANCSEDTTPCAT